MVFISDIVWRVLRSRLFDGVRPSLVRFDAYRLEGRLGGSGSVFSVVVVGSKVCVEYFSKFLFEGVPRVDFLGRFSLGRVVSGVGLSADLVVVDSGWFFSGFLGDHGFVLSPRVDFVLDIAGRSVEDIEERVARDKRRRLRQVAGGGYSFEVTRDLSKFESFYYDMYLPHMLRRHSGSALPLSFAECRELFLSGELLLVKLGDEWVSGNLLVSHGKELHSPVLGVKDDSGQFTLGSYAAYYFSMVVGVERGFERVDFGEAPPFMQDGLFRFKKGLGMSVRSAVGSGAQVFGLRFSGVGESVRRFLSVCPFVFVGEGGGLFGLVFLESVDVLSVGSCFVSGLSGLFVVSSCVGVSGLDGFRVEGLSVGDCGGLGVLSFLGGFCVEGKYALYRITRS
jgi:Acetyltransferase (GNAT) domain